MLNPNFSSGPCSKRPAWNIDALKSAPVGRSHRSALGKERIVKAMNDTRKVLNIPSDYLVGILPASDTDRKSTRLNSSHSRASRMPSSA